MENFVERAMSKKGQFASVEWKRPCATLKSCTATIEKRTVAHNVRIGANYENLHTTKEGRADGTLPSENQGLRGMAWEQFPVVLHSLKTGKQYIRIETAKNTQFNTQYFMNGKEVNKSDIEQYLQAKEKKSGDIPTVMNISVETVQSLK